MYVTELRLNRFRAALQTSLHFERDLTILTGPNGSGKSTILDAIKIMLSWFTAFTRSASSRGQSMSDRDVSNQSPFAVLSINCQTQSFGDEELWWTRLHTRRGRTAQRTLFNDSPPATSMRQLRHWTERLRETLTTDSSKVELPVLVYYPVHRAVLDIPLRIRKTHNFDPIDTYEDSLRTGVNFRSFFEWFRKREDLENELFRNADFEHPFSADTQLNAVRLAIQSFLPDITNVSIKRNPLRMIVAKANLELTVDQMSDGEKCLLALVGDLARRLAMANPSMRDPLGGKGIVLIDEIDLHLHPKWQRSVAQNLQRTFPGCQFILTTHSPQVLGEVEARCVRKLTTDGDYGMTVSVPKQSFGLDSSSILEEEMNAHSRNAGIKHSISSIFQCIDSEDFSTAQDLIKKLEIRLGGSIPELIRAETLITMLGPQIKGTK